MENNDEIWQKSSIQCKLHMIIRGARTGHTEQYRWSFVERQIVSSKSMSKNASENVSNQNKLFWWFLRNSLFWHFNSHFVLKTEKKTQVFVMITENFWQIFWQIFWHTFWRHYLTSYNTPANKDLTPKSLALHLYNNIWKVVWIVKQISQHSIFLSLLF